MLKKPIKSFLLIILTFLLCEVIVFFYLKNFDPVILQVRKVLAELERNIGYKSQPYLNYVNNTSQIDKFGNKPINKFGIRYWKEIDFEKPKHTYRILFLGGSTTFGDVNDDYDVFARLIEKKIEKNLVENPEKFDFKKIECLNAGVHGLTSAEILNHYHFKHQYLQPDMIVVHTGFNDAFAYSGINNVKYQPDYNNIRRVYQNPRTPSKTEKLLLNSNIFSYFWIKNYYDIFLETTLEKNAFYHFTAGESWFPEHKNFTDSLHYNAFYKNIRLLVTEAKMNNSKVILCPVVADINRMPPELGKNLLNGLSIHTTILEKISLETNSFYCKLPQEDFGTELFLNDDGIHVNEAGEKLKADFIHNCIINLISKEIN